MVAILFGKIESGMLWSLPLGTSSTANGRHFLSRL